MQSAFHRRARSENKSAGFSNVRGCLFKVLLKSPRKPELPDALDSETVVSPPNELLPLVYVRTPAAKNDYFRRSYCQHGINDCVAYAQQRESFALAGAARELGSLRPPPDGCRFEERILDLERSLREERRALRRADTFYGRLAFRRF
jgi:hypothetical protein